LTNKILKAPAGKLNNGALDFAIAVGYNNRQTQKANGNEGEK